MKIDLINIDIIPRFIPSVKVSFEFQITKSNPGYLKDSISNTKIIIAISDYLLIKWGFDFRSIDSNDVIRLSFPFAEKILREKILDQTVSEREEYQLTTENQDDNYPYDFEKIPTFENLSNFSFEIKDLNFDIGTQIATNLLADKIITLRDNINALFYEKYKENLLKLVQERNILYLFRKIDTNENFTYFIATLGNLVTDLNKDILFKILRLKKSDIGSINLLSEYLKLDTINKTEVIVDSFRKINKIRQGFPIHTDKTGIIKALKHFGIEYPINDFNKSKDILLENYMNTLEVLLESVKETIK